MNYDVNIKIWFRNPKIKRFAVFKNHKIVTRKIRMENNNKKIFISNPNYVDSAQDKCFTVIKRTIYFWFFVIFIK